MISRCLAGTRALYLVGSVLTAGPLAGQTPYRVTRGPAQLLAAWVHDRETLDDRSGASLDSHPGLPLDLSCPRCGSTPE